MAMMVLLISTLPILFQRHIAMPTKKDELGWSILEEITRKPHPYNSDENLRVRNYLIEQLEKLKEDYATWNCSQPNPIQVQCADSRLKQMISIYSTEIPITSPTIFWCVLMDLHLKPYLSRHTSTLH
jgi:hypothetical protein